MKEISKLNKIDEAVGRLREIGCYAKPIGEEPLLSINGAFRLEFFEDSKAIRYVEDAFSIMQDGDLWTLELAGPGHGSTVLGVSPLLSQAVAILEIFFMMKSRTTISSKNIRDVIKWLQRKGLEMSLLAEGAVRIEFTSTGADQPKLSSRLAGILRPRADIWELKVLSEPELTVIYADDDPNVICEKIVAFMKGHSGQ